MAIEGVDYSYSRPGGAALKKAGKKFAVRYITTPGVGNKGISQSEFDDLRKNGIAVPVVWEGGAADMKRGKVQGIADAKAAAANLKKIDGLDDNLPVYFACDFDAAPGDQAAINAYLDGAAEVLGRDRVGIYGGYYPVKRARDAKKATWLWQTYAWSGGQILDGIHLYQYHNGVNLNGAVDYCRALTAEYGQHANVSPKPVPAPAPATKPAPAQTDAEIDAAAIKKPISDQSIMLIKGPAGNPEIYVFNPITGTKRHISGPEWKADQAFGLKYAVLSEATIQGIPDAA